LVDGKLVIKLIFSRLSHISKPSSRLIDRISIGYFLLHGVNIMIMQNKISCLVVTAICLTTLSLPSHAWQAARGANGGAAVRGPNGVAVRGPNGNTAARSYHGGGAYRAPVPYGYRGGTYNNGYSSGQVAGAAVAGAVVGAAIANRNQPPPPPPTTVIIQQPMY
jgi:hypothetical protein